MYLNANYVTGHKNKCFLLCSSVKSGQTNAPIELIKETFLPNSATDYHWLGDFTDQFEKATRWGNMTWNQYTHSKFGKGVLFVHIKDETKHEQISFKDNNSILSLIVTKFFYDVYKYEIMWPFWWVTFRQGLVLCEWKCTTLLNVWCHSERHVEYYHLPAYLFCYLNLSFPALHHFQWLSYLQQSLVSSWFPLPNEVIAVDTMLSHRVFYFHDLFTFIL